VLIGLTLAVDASFKILFVVVVFHRGFYCWQLCWCLIDPTEMFEGLGIGSRLAYMRLPAKYNWVPIAGALLYGITTPIGIAVGLGVKTTYNPGSTTASIVSGVLDSLSAGILLYTGLVEVKSCSPRCVINFTNMAAQLLAHEFLFNKEMMSGSNANLTYALVCMCLGCALMALLGKWA
jgi:solute carrier family 39 (zinc transporter), member 1/2/3